MLQAFPGLFFQDKDCLAAKFPPSVINNSLQAMMSIFYVEKNEVLNTHNKMYVEYLLKGKNLFVNYYPNQEQYGLPTCRWQTRRN